jgi:hypothetical protein
MSSKLKALLMPKKHLHEIADGVHVQIKELSLKERIEWRKAAIAEDGDSLKDDWIQALLHLAVLDEDGSKVWESADEVDGSEEIIKKILELVQDVNGLKSESVDEAEKN